MGGGETHRSQLWAWLQSVRLFAAHIKHCRLCLIATAQYCVMESMGLWGKSFAKKTRSRHHLTRARANDSQGGMTPLQSSPRSKLIFHQMNSIMGIEFEVELIYHSLNKDRMGR